MAWRLLKYMVSIWTKLEQERKTLWSEQKEEGISSEKRVQIYPLPTIFPVVFYNGKEKWTTPTFLAKSEVFERVQGMTSFFPDFQYILTDLCHMKDEDFEQYKEHIHCYHILKFKSHTHAGEIVPAIESMLDYFQWLYETNQDLAHILLTLSFYVEGKDSKTQQQIAKILSEKIDQGEDMPILLEQIRKEGQEKGREEGKREALLETAKTMLKEGCTPVFIQKITGLTIEEINSFQEE